MPVSAPRRPQDTLREPQEGPRGSSEGQNHSKTVNPSACRFGVSCAPWLKMVPRGRRRSQRGPKLPPRGSQETAQTA
eukprot:8192814-Pyramimonas_sp.AAC.1